MYNIMHQKKITIYIKFTFQYNKRHMDWAVDEMGLIITSEICFGKGVQCMSGTSVDRWHRKLLVDGG